MKAKEIRSLDASARAKELNGLLREHFSLRTQLATGQTSDIARFKKIKRDIARIRTIAREMQDQDVAVVTETKKAAQSKGKKSVFKKMIQGKKKA